ncbi:hypothetical protein [Kitasatospora sp. GP82]|uniref:hypothetical protein n=1 Tax=Kitasatospora sp. GP82 TaxID=3035089 RepID=UPI0024736E9C|nr:hypothetical protein [Kitasatospora sp. GP82]MDH6129601.1 hypothetical protein [Kitasatospora sp. GP82]
MSVSRPAAPRTATVFAAAVTAVALGLGGPAAAQARTPLDEARLSAYDTSVACGFDDGYRSTGSAADCDAFGRNDDTPDTIRFRPVACTRFHGSRRVEVPASYADCLSVIANPILPRQ